MTFEQSLAHLTSMGITVFRDHERQNGVDVPLNIFTRFEPPFTPEEWCQIARSMGNQYVGGCCAQSSAIQDVVCDWFRFGGAIPIADLARIAEMSILHDGPSSAFHTLPMPVKEMVAAHPSSDLWERLALIWHLVKDYYVVKAPTAYHPKFSEGDKAIRTIQDVATALSYHRVFNKDSNTEQDQAERLMQLARMVPSLRYVLNHVDEYTLGASDFEGWALVELDKSPESICQNSYGLCLYREHSTARHVLKISLEHATRQVKLGIRPVRVDLTCDQGPVFTGPVEIFTQTD